ncbi:MAG: RNB domain-containing ribonuclease [bacterium]|nr:RNB domain-containing ribonuclease [bacterium]
MLEKNSLVLYKNQPARVVKVGDKIEVELKTGSTKTIRPKDVTLLHPGPINSLKELTPKTGDIETAREVLAGETTTIAELCEFVFEEYTPGTAWAAVQILEDGLYFHGTPDKITAATAEEVVAKKNKRHAKETEKKNRAEFLARVKENKIIADDFPRLKEIEQLAMGKDVKSPLLKELSISATPQNAHALLLKLGRWDELKNPYPSRLNVSLEEPGFLLPDLPEEERLDLTHLESYAIDDEGSTDPDDAISLDGERIWIHVADAAALVTPDDDADKEARKIAANLYLPEIKVPMLPPKATELLALGLQEVSPALSFGLTLSETGEITDMTLTPSLVKVTRTTYAKAEEKLGEEPFKSLYQLALRFQARRKEKGAVMFDFPEVTIRVKEGKVSIRPLPALNSRQLVAESMFMAGEAAARFALDNKIPFPFTNQDAPEGIKEAKDLAAMFALRFKMKRSRMQSVAKPHSGLGLDLYARTTSPLRRYLDLVVHQQLRAFLKGEPVLDEQELMLRVGVAEAAQKNVSVTERFANKHWTLVYLLQNPGKRYEGILVEDTERRTTVVIPELALDVPVHLKKKEELNTRFTMEVSSIDLPHLVVHFSIC